MDLEIIGHRGGFEPYNTIEGLNNSITNGLKIAEIDIEMSKDKVPFVIHTGYNGIMDAYLKKKNTYVIFYLLLIIMYYYIVNLK